MQIKLYLKGAMGRKAFQRYKFSPAEIERLLTDFKGYQRTGAPIDGIYIEDNGQIADQSVMVEFGEIDSISIEMAV